MSNSSYASNLIAASQVFSTSSSYINFGLGFIGNLLNILVLTNLKIFHLNRCAFYLIVESFVDIGQLINIFVNELWKFSLNGVDPTTVSLAWCKLKTVWQQWCRLMLASIVCFTAIDQYLSTNHRAYLRQFSSFKVARRQIYFAILLCLLHTIPFTIFTDINPSLGCIITSNSLENYYSYFFYSILDGLLPMFISSLFSVLAYRNVRHIIRRQVSIDRRRLDQQLTAMIFVRVISFVLLQLPYSINRIVVVNVASTQGNITQYIINLWVRAISKALIFFTNAANFYIFIATSSRYRHQVKYYLVKCWQSLRQTCCGGINVVQPLHGITTESIAELE